MITNQIIQRPTKMTGIRVKNTTRMRIYNHVSTVNNNNSIEIHTT